MEQREKNRDVQRYPTTVIHACHGKTGHRPLDVTPVFRRWVYKYRHLYCVCSMVCMVFPKASPPHPPGLVMSQACVIG